MRQKSPSFDRKFSIFIKRKKRRRKLSSSSGEQQDDNNGKSICDPSTSAIHENSTQLDHSSERRRVQIENRLGNTKQATMEVANQVIKPNKLLVIQKTKSRLAFNSLLFPLLMLCIGILQDFHWPSPTRTGAAAATSTAAKLSLPPPPPNEYQLIAQAKSNNTRLPCLIGKKVYCGEPYFIAWYKFNVTNRSWLRIESSSDNDESYSVESNQKSAAADHFSRPLNDRVQFLRHRSGEDNEDEQELQLQQHHRAPQLRSSPSCFSGSQAGAASRQFALLDQFDCAQLNINSLELNDEGQYKCEITFSDSLDFEKCPSSTVTQLIVVARPNEPEILVNGRVAIAPQQQQQTKQAGQTAGSGSSQPLHQFVFKEGAQVRLECQSAGGKPAPRIDWLNLSLPTDGRPPELHLMRTVVHQQQQQQLKKKSAIGGDMAIGQQSASYLQATTTSSTRDWPTTTSSMTIQLSRFDLQSQFVCLVLPQQQQPQQLQLQIDQATAAIPDEWRSGATLAKLLDKIPMLANARGTKLAGDVEPMLKWIRFDVLAKPLSVSMNVRDLTSNTQVRPIVLNWPAAATGQPEANQSPSSVQQSASSNANRFYSLQPNRLYAVQCLVENSRPRSQVVWFNRTALIDLETIQLESSDHLLPNQRQSNQHRLTSFVRYVKQENGLIRTIASLLITPNYFDNFEEFFCRVSNDAFQFDELAQVAPILSAKIYVNFPASSWIDSPTKSVHLNWTASSSNVRSSSSSSLIAKVGAKLNDEFQLRCNVAANPLNQNAILQIDWLKDGRILAPSVGAAAATTTTSSSSPSAASLFKQTIGNNNPATSNGNARLRIEKTNHLHMPQQQQQLINLGQLATSGDDELDWRRGASLAVGNNNNEPVQMKIQSSSAAASSGSISWPPSLASNRLFASSQLTVSKLVRADSGLYSCQYKLIPTQSEQQQTANRIAGHHHNNHNQQHQQTMKIVSGQANQSVQLELLEADESPSPPLIRVQSSSGLLFYDKVWIQRATNNKQEQQQATLTTVVLDRPNQQVWLSLKCDLNGEEETTLEFGHKIIWYLNGLFLYSSSQTDVYNISLHFESGEQQLPFEGGLVSCAHHMLASNNRFQDEDIAVTNQVAEFNGAHSIRVLESKNRVRFLYKVEPKLFNRRDLMPTMRSLTTTAKQQSRIKSVCLAQCEPISVCSIDWLLNGQKLNERSNQILETTKASRTPTNVNETLLSIKSLKQFSSAIDQNLRTVQFEELMQQQQQQRSQTQPGNSSASSKFAWFKQTNLLLMKNMQNSMMNFDLVDLKGQQAEHELRDDDWKLMMADNQQQQANIISRLDLSYEQLVSMFSREATTSADSLLLECRLNINYDAKQPNHRQQGEADQNDEINSSAFNLIRVRPYEWFPSESSSSATTISENGEPIFSTIEDDGDPSSVGVRSLKTTIRLMDGPNDVRIQLDGSLKSFESSLVGSSNNARELILNERQLIDLFNWNTSSSGGGADSMGPPPLLKCTTGDDERGTGLKWTWRNHSTNNAEESIIVDGHAQANLDLRQLHRQAKPNLGSPSQRGFANNKFDLISSVANNYTCQTMATTTNSRTEIKTDSLALKVQGRPVCKLSLGNQFLNEQNELLISLICSFYSLPQLVEAIWFRNNQQIATFNSNKTNQDELGRSELQVVILNKQQEFMLTDLMSQSGNFKCVARNSLGYSEACELDPLDKSILLNSFKPMSLAKSPTLQMLSQPTTSTLIDHKFNGSTTTSLLQNEQLTHFDPSRGQNAADQQQQQQHQATGSFAPILRRWISSRFDWLLIGICLIASIWLIAMFGSAYIKRHYYSPTGHNNSNNIAALYGLPTKCNNRKSSSLKRKKRTTGIWRFNLSNNNNQDHHSNLSRASSTTNVELPFGQLTKHSTTNYYGNGAGTNSNGGDSSEHDMIQSCSQSSHYEDFIQHQLQLQQQQLRQQQQHLVATTTARQSRNVPLIDGDRSRTSRIRLDQQNPYSQHQLLYAQRINHQLTFGRPAPPSAAAPTVATATRQQQQPIQLQEHIYDDVIYNQMIF